MGGGDCIIGSRNLHKEDHKADLEPEISGL